MKGLAMKIKDFTRRNEKELPREEGFPILRRQTAGVVHARELETWQDH